MNNSKLGEDSLNLGPFLQRYVLNSIHAPVAGEKRRRTKRASGGEAESRAPALGGGDQRCASMSSRSAQNSQADIRDWILNHYRFLPGFGATMRLTCLLGEAKQFFPHLTTLSLTKLIKSSFPDCHKIPDKKGAYYQGLVKRPELGYYDDANLLSAVSDIMCGKMSLEQAKATYDIEEAKIIQMIMWAPNDGQHGDTSLVISQLYPSNMLVNKATTAMTRRKAKGGEDTDTSSEASSEAKRPRGSGSGRHKSKRRKKRASKDGGDFDITLDKLFLEDPMNVQVERGPKKCEYEGGSDDTLQDSAFCSSNVSDKSSTSGSSDDERKKKERDKVLMELKEEIGQLQEKLSHEDSANEWLRTEVTCSRQQTERLRAELSLRDAKYASLAEKFIMLNTQFQKIAQHIKSNMGVDEYH